MTTTPPAVDTAATLGAALPRALQVVEGNIAAFLDWYPDDTTVDGVYRPRVARDGQPTGSNVGWTTGFWPGMLWLAYDETDRPVFREAGERHVADFAARVDDGVDLTTHDLGFLYTLSCVAAWRLTGSAEARRAALSAADHLMTRRLEPAGIIQAWGDLHDPAQRGRTIVDSLMNMPLLHWASEQTGDPVYAETAKRHCAQVREHMIRPDDTTFHTFYWDAVTGEPLSGATQQGHADNSCWARGQAWGVYGFALNHRWTGDPLLLEAAIRCAEHFLAHLPEDRVAYWDLVFGDGSGAERDSSSAAIVACGLDELARMVDHDPERKRRYEREARHIATSLAESYTAPADGAEDGGRPLLLHGVYDMPKLVGVDEGSLWGDYFYLEALVRLSRPAWKPFW